MKTIGELLRDADPLQHESTYSPSQREVRRQAVLTAASGSRPPAGGGSRWRTAAVVTVAVAVIATSLLRSRVSPFVSELQAAVRFEVRLAENNPAPGLREAKVSGSDRSVYLRDEVIVNNGDIAAARVVPGDGPSQYSIGVEFNASGAGKIRAATGNHIGKPVAILLDGQVVMTPVVRVPIGASAVISDNFTKAEAERIVNGIGIQ